MEVRLIKKKTTTKASTFVQVLSNLPTNLEKCNIQLISWQPFYQSSYIDIGNGRKTYK